MSFKDILTALIRRLSRVNELFSRAIIIFCIGYMVRVTERCLDIAESGGTAHYVLQYASMFFGGELILLIAKRLTRDVGASKAERIRIMAGHRQDTD